MFKQMEAIKKTAAQYIQDQYMIDPGFAEAMSEVLVTAFAVYGQKQKRGLV